MAEKFQRTYGLTDFGITANKTVVPAQWNTVGVLTVPAGQMITFGANEATSLAGGSGAPAYLAFYEDGGAQGTIVAGVVRLAIANATQTNVVVLAELRTERLAADQTDRNKAALVPEGGVYRTKGKPTYAQRDSKLLIQFYPDSATSKTIVYNGTNTKLLMPVSILQ